MGYAEAAAAVQDAYLEKRYADAAAAVPLEFLDAVALLGPRERIAEKMAAYAEAGVTTLNVSLHGERVDHRDGAPDGGGGTGTLRRRGS